MRGRAKEPGLKALPVPEKNDLRPGTNSVFPYLGARRAKILEYVGPVDFVHDIGSPAGDVAQSPSSASYTIGLRKTNVQGPGMKDPKDLTIQPGIRRT